MNLVDHWGACAPCLRALLPRLGALHWLALHRRGKAEHEHD
jgi:hypothetical protein